MISRTLAVYVKSSFQKRRAAFMWSVASSLVDREKAPGISTRCLCWPSRVAAVPQHRHTSAVTSRLESVNGHFAHLPSQYWISHSPGQTSQNEPFIVLHQLSGTRCLRPLWSRSNIRYFGHSNPFLIDWLIETIMYLNLGLRCTSSVSFLINTHDWPAAIASEAKALGTL